jgi:hypothetical protein
MPEGYYETSIAGDHRLLGWHLNHVDTSDPARFRTLASEFFPMSRYEKQLRKPGVLDAVLRSGDPVAALATVNGTPVVQKPPTIRVIGPRPAAPGAEIVAVQPELRLDIEAEASPERRVRSVVVRSDAVRYPAHAIDPGLALARATETIRLRPDRNVVTIEATDDLGVKAIERLEVRLDAARLAEPWVASPPRLVIRSFGVEAFRDRDIDPIPFATRDAEELAAFFNEQAHFSKERIDLKVEPDADEKRMLGAFDSLAEDARNRKLKAGDTVLIILESHLIRTDSAGAVVLSADSSIKPGADRALRGSTIAERLDEVTKSGCLVLLLVDGVHRTTPRTDPNAIRDWIRDLYDERGVLVFAASNHGPSERYGEKQLGVFALAVLESQDVAARAKQTADGPTTLDEFSEAVKARVLERSARRQHAGFYAPESLSWKSIRIFDPQPAPVDQLVKK